MFWFVNLIIDQIRVSAEREDFDLRGWIVRIFGSGKFEKIEP